VTRLNVTVRMVGGPRDGNTLDLDAHVLGARSLYLSAPNAPGTYWRAAGLTPLVLEFLPAPGGEFTEAPVELQPSGKYPATEVLACQ
jgi:hypothetical protein